MTKQETPFERMKRFVAGAGYSLEEVGEEYGRGYGFLHRGEDEEDGMYIYIGSPTGKEYYWQLDGKIAAESRSTFNKWSQAPFFTWLPETDDEAKRIMDVVKFLGTEEGKNRSDAFDIINVDFGFEIPQYESE